MNNIHNSVGAPIVVFMTIMVTTVAKKKEKKKKFEETPVRSE